MLSATAQQASKSGKRDNIHLPWFLWFPLRKGVFFVSSHNTLWPGQDRTGQNRTEQDRTGQDSTLQYRTGQDRAGQNRTGQTEKNDEKSVFYH